MKYGYGSMGSPRKGSSPMKGSSGCKGGKGGGKGGPKRLRPKK